MTSRAPLRKAVRATSLTLSKNTLALNLREPAQLTATVLPANTETKTLAWASSNPDVAKVYDNGLVEAVAAGTCTITVTTTDGSGLSASCTVTVANTMDGHEFVDLGLPSKTLWATTNIGATNPEDYGLYFQWGDTIGHAKGAGYDFGIDTYLYGEYDIEHCTPDGDFYFFTKYCTDAEWGYHGFTDGPTELETSDDAAYVNWSENWRMPSAEQVAELFNGNNTTQSWTTRNQVPGMLVTSIAYPDRSIFIPAAGNYIGILLYEEGEEAKTWTRTLDLNQEYQGRNLLGRNGDAGVAPNHRYLGLPVRPVLAEKAVPAENITPSP